jgi:hypothetical protein
VPLRKANGFASIIEVVGIQDGLELVGHDDMWLGVHPMLLGLI